RPSGSQSADCAFARLWRRLRSRGSSSSAASGSRREWLPGWRSMLSPGSRSAWQPPQSFRAPRVTDPGGGWRRPSLGSPTYAVRAPLARWLREEGQLAARRDRKPRLLDVGCGVKPYEPFFREAVAEYVGVDVANP